MSKPAHAGGPCGRRNVTSSTQTRRVAMQMGRPLRGLGDDHAAVVLGLTFGSPRAIFGRLLRRLDAEGAISLPAARPERHSHARSAGFM